MALCWLTANGMACAEFFRRGRLYQQGLSNGVVLSSHGGLSTVLASPYVGHAVMRRFVLVVCAGALLLFGTAMQGAWAQHIFTCVDANGRKITADRSIVDCLDREQQELSRSGMVLRKLGPTMTMQERAAQELVDKALVAEQLRLLDNKRRDRAMLSRYPNVGVHHRERNAALSVMDELTASSIKRSQELTQERDVIAREMEFYAKDPSKAPYSLKNRRDGNVLSLREQQTFVANQALEKQRLNKRFDDELETLKPLWARSGSAATPAR